MWRRTTARNPPPLPLPDNPYQPPDRLPEPGHLSSPFLSSPDSPTKYVRSQSHARTNSMKLDQLYFARQKGHSPSASTSRMSSSTTVAMSPTLPMPPFNAGPDVSSMADQLNLISTTTTSILTTLQTLMRRSKDNASELDNLKKQVLASTERDSQTVDEIKKLLSSANSTTDLSALFTKLDSLAQKSTPSPPPEPAPVPSAHKLEEEKKAVENILSNANQALTHLLTLTDSINTLTTHLNSTTTRLTTEQTQIDNLRAQKSTLEKEIARLEATIHLRNLELASFTKKAEILESRVQRAKTAVQLSGAKNIKMKKSPLILAPGKTASPATQKSVPPATPITPQRRILSLSSTSNKGSPARALTEYQNGVRKTSWSKRLGGMLSNLSLSGNKENVSDTGTMTKSRTKTYVLSGVDEGDVLALGVPGVPRQRSVSEIGK
jgi:myosin heavy subunit